MNDSPGGPNKFKYKNKYQNIILELIIEQINVQNGKMVVLVEQI